MSICAYFPACRGCDFWGESVEQQALNKLKHLQQTLKLDAAFLDPAQNFVSIQSSGLRHRFDFTFEVDEEQKMGFYDRDRKLIDLEVCLQLSPELQKVFSEFRALRINTGATQIKKGSVRLRIGPTGLKGCWLDLANIDIKALMDDSVYLNQLLEAGFHVEIGQKAKVLRRIDSKLKLTEPQAREWFRTKDFMLRSYVSDFTQPSWLSADKMVDLVLNWIRDRNFKSVIEFGPGIGQFTLPLLAHGMQVRAFENNPKAVEVLQVNAAAYGLEKKLRISLGDFQNKTPAINDQNFDLVLVNPPRSGLKNFVSTVIATQARFCIYISCFPESMKTDVLQLQQAGYKIHDAKIVDQFPQTSHYESCVLLEKT